MRITNDIELIPASNEILISAESGTRRIQIENQLMQILVIMADAKGSLVEKQVFIDKVWSGNSYTGDAALTKNIFKLCEHFKVNQIDDRLTIETIPKKGYRLMVKGVDTVKNKTGFSFISILVVVLFITGVLLLIFNRQTTPDAPKVTVVENDTIIQLDKNKVRVIELDTVRAPVINRRLKD